MNLIPGIDTTAGALHAEKTRMDIIAQNIANANTTRDANGEVYKRKDVIFESYMVKATDSDGKTVNVKNVRVADIVDDDTPGPKIFNPSHPHADAEGMVEMPNVKTSTEMVNLISASRAYEANLSVFKTSRAMARQALSIGR